MKNRIARILALILLAGALSPLGVGQTSFRGYCDRMDNPARAGWAHVTFSSDLSNRRHERHVGLTVELFGYSMRLSLQARHRRLAV